MSATNSGMLDVLSGSQRDQSMQHYVRVRRTERKRCDLHMTMLGPRILEDGQRQGLHYCTKSLQR